MRIRRFCGHICKLSADSAAWTSGNLAFVSATDSPDWQGPQLNPPSTSPPEFNFFPGARQQTRLAPAWSRIIALGWLLEMFALICVGASSQIIGRPVIWLDDQRWGSVMLTILVVATCFPLMATALWSLFHGPQVFLVSAVPTSILMVLAVLDRDSSPGSAVVTFVLAISGLLLMVGAFAGRYRLSNLSSATTASN